MSAQWYYRADGETFGPVDAQELRRLARSGRIERATLLRHGADEWVAARSVPGLFDEVTADAPHPPADIQTLALPPDADHDLPEPTPAGRAALTAFGVVTLVVASVLAVAACTSGVGSVWCLSAGNQLMQDADAQQKKEAADAQAQPQGARPAPWSGCGSVISAFVGLFALAIGFALAVLMLLHTVLAGGQLAAGVGVLRRRQWGRVLALVFSVLTGLYGAGALYLVGSRLLDTPPPTGSDAWWMAAAAGLGLLFLAHAILAWVVLLHPACAADFRAGRAPVA